MWPVFYVVNDLPFSLRKNNVLLHGLWSGAGKPKMECFLTPTVDELAALNKNKLTWQTKQGNTFETIVKLDLLVCDSIARRRHIKTTISTSSKRRVEMMPSALAKKVVLVRPRQVEKSPTAGIYLCHDAAKEVRHIAKFQTVQW